MISKVVLAVILGVVGEVASASSSGGEVAGIVPLATVTYEYGSGTESGYCDGTFAWSCMEQLKTRARDRASNDGRWRCGMRGGKADTFYPSCNDNCTPFSIPPDAKMQYVSCTSNCTIRCEVP